MHGQCCTPREAFSPHQSVPSSGVSLGQEIPTNGEAGADSGDDSNLPPLGEAIFVLGHSLCPEQEFRMC